MPVVRTWTTSASAQIVELTATKDHDATHPRTVVEIEEVTP